MLKRLSFLVMAMTLIIGTIAASVQPAEARRGRNVAAGVAAGIIGLGVLGAIANANEPSYRRSCYRGPRECYWTDRHCFYNRYGDQVCRGGRQICERRTICD